MIRGVENAHVFCHKQSRNALSKNCHHCGDTPAPRDSEVEFLIAYAQFSFGLLLFLYIMGLFLKKGP